MKKPIQKILMLLVVFYFFNAYKEIKKGFIEGYYAYKEKTVKTTVNYKNKVAYKNLDFPFFIKIF